MGLTQNDSPAGTYRYDFVGQPVWGQTLAVVRLRPATFYLADGHPISEFDDLPMIQEL